MANKPRARKGKKQGKTKQLTLTGMIAVGLLAGADYFNLIPPEISQAIGQTTQSVTSNNKTQDLNLGQGKNQKRPDQQLAESVLTPSIKAQLKSESVKFNGTGAFIVNGGKTNLDASVNVAPYVQLNAQDSLGRPGAANAFLNKSSREYRSREETGNDKKMNPVGWKQKKLDGQDMLFNRGHSIAYAIAGSIKGFDASVANPQNITTQTAWANQSSNGNDQNTGQNYYETLVRRSLDNNKQVRYRVTPLYEGDNLVPSGSHIEAKAKDGSLEFNVFVPNVQPGVKINYRTGDSTAA
ncbi:DNA/RNA non-specific endonuclease [Weissella tructae]|uniref:DNA/RNA non-specific endonuclease n=1 Tax=Weissella TaxID=46255 RepID=UPI0002AAAE23|nr:MULTISPECIES: DNA/RNA non-specific endonuclease [Weissella]ELA06722.1 competence associated membrane nuclease [Weissella ceti NC36]QVV90985.1 DNA/RNA non-specific endonuclease [Weissella tructae]